MSEDLRREMIETLERLLERVRNKLEEHPA